MRRKNSFRLSAALRWALMGVTCAFFALSVIPALAGDPIATLRGGVPIGEEPTPPTLAGAASFGQNFVRNYPEQPPIIPHKVRDYRIDLNSNKCLSCHSRKSTEISEAPMISVTHFIDRDGQVLSQPNARRYFCTQCHVPQFGAKPLVENIFIDADDLASND